MQTQMLVEEETDLYVEVLGDGSEPNRKVPLVDFPFIIGRNETCSLPVESGRVSREHAEIVKHGSGYLIRDLNSTNGTFVNAERIKEHPLADGDTIKIADFEFDFHRPDPHAMRQTLTLAMDEDAPQKKSTKVDADAMIGALRQLGQITAAHSLNLLTTSILDAHSGAAIATWIPPVGECLGELSRPHREILAAHPRLSNTLRQVQHASLVRASLTSKIETTASILFHLTGKDCEDPHLVDSFGWMRARFGPSVEIVACVRLEEAEHESARRARLYDLLSVGVQFGVIGLDQFRPLPVSTLLDRARYVGISATSLGAASRSPAVAQNLEEFLKDLADSDRVSIACGVTSEQETELCQALGFQAITKDFSNN